uniref:Zinc finger, CCHC-type n=1 Tax=Tanacetum cinerariifolium TaxID=118510 RepID=A0A6L2KH75_TANCI|nr:zinc finger, CCHC-type [Tanacetum cinerariifolium]
MVLQLGKTLLRPRGIMAFEKCVSCMSGKMARKPYTHQVEMAKDLLGLIHTDVCGPFMIMSRQGASYFVPFTDDFSRYGYVYLLKHKHEVFETFKVFQKEVENQLGKTIKSLRSDRGGEYTSQEFLDHLKDHGIIAHRTPPYTPQHNGVSERRNITLLDMVRSMMSQTTLSKSFWDYALETAARILNMVPTKKVENTPYEKQKLTGPNFIDWYRQLRIVLSIEDKLRYLEQPIPPAPIVHAGQHVAPEILTAHTAWIKGSKEIASLMLMTMEPDIQRNLETFHAHEMLLELKTLFSQQAEQELLQTMRDFHSCKQEERQSVSSYVLKMKGYINNLERLGHPVTLGLGVSLILIGLRKEFDGFVQNYNMHSLGKTINELRAMLKLHEQTLPKNNAPALHAIRAGKVQKVNKHKKWQPQMAARGQNHGKGKNKQAYAHKPKIPPPPKREDPTKDSICHECGETGHWKRNYPQYLAELLKKKKNTASGAGDSGIFVIELNTILNRSWIYDTGCGTHICNTTQGLRERRKLKPWALSLYVGNSQREAVEEVENQLGKTIKSLRSDRRGEYMSQEFLDHLKDHGIIAHRNPLYTPQHNRVSEKRNRTLLDMVRSMMSQTTLPKSFWDYALKTIARILNMVPTKKVENTPYKVWHEQAPKLSYLKVWGCEALVKRDTLTKPDKLKPRSIKCIFIGYPKETMGYSFYYPPENKVLVARNAKFLENSLITQVASGSLEDLEIIQEEDTHPSIDTSLNYEEDDLEIDKSQSDIIPIRRSTRTRHAPNRMSLYIDAEEHELGDLCEPANYKAALLDHESEKWLNAMNVEMQSMKDNEVWVLVELPPNVKTVGSKWLFKKKTDMDGVVHTYKAHLVAKGYTQTLGIDYEETFSLVAYIRAIRILIAIAAYYDYKIWQMDVKTSFLNGYLNEKVYMEQPEGFVNPKYPNRKSATQSIFATSSAEAKYIVAFDASKEAVWVRKFISGLGITKGPRHFRAKVHYLHEVIEYGDVKLEKVHTYDNLADPFTKALAFPKHSEHTMNIGMLPSSSLM